MFVLLGVLILLATSCSEKKEVKPLYPVIAQELFIGEVNFNTYKMDKSIYYIDEQTFTLLSVGDTINLPNYVEGKKQIDRCIIRKMFADSQEVAMN